jgi:hypothetical protein
MKKKILYLLVATFCISAVLGIGIIVLDLWNDLTAKVLLSTVTIFGFSIPALCCSTLFEKDKYRAFSIIGMCVCIISGIYCLLYTWEILDLDLFDSDFPWQSIISCIMYSVSLGHLSLMLLVNNKDETVTNVRNFTIIVSVFLLVILTLLIWVEDFEDVLAWQIYVIDAILVVLGTIVTPILSKARAVEEKKENLEKTMVEEQGEKVKNKIEEIEVLRKMVEKGYILEKEFDVISDRIIKKNS